ncbi:MAG: flagellar protein FlgN [Verrucomicrobia bacterium]|nr:flagellar protein FlgN [Verrucomicrobiota bacterium]
MIENIEKLIDALREELKQYGEMLALLDHQQEFVVARAADDVLRTVASINAQSGVIEDARSHRELCKAELSDRLGLDSEAAFSRIIEVVPEHYRPLLNALIDENNDLVARIQRRARQNHTLLMRSLEMMQSFLSNVFQSRKSTLYGASGELSDIQQASRAIYEAMG